MKLCCVCLLENPPNMNVFDNSGIKLNVAEIVNKYLWFKPIIKDALTSQICTECWNKIYDFHYFYLRVEKVHKDFKGIHTNIKEEDKPSTSNIKQENVEDNFENNLVQIEIDDHKISENYDVSIETKNPLDDDSNTDVDYEFENENYSEGNETSEISGHDYEYETVEKNANSKIAFKGGHIKRNKATKRATKRKASTISKLNTRIDPSKSKRVSHRLDPILTDEVIKKHIQMACNLCIYVGKTFSDIVEHFKGHHDNVKPYIMCCDKKFTRSYCIAQHAYIHENPNSFSCTECNKSFTTSYGLRIHNISYHASEEERMHACEHCPRKFGRRNLLELHKQTHIPKEQWTIVCTKCTTRTAKFATQYMLNIHTSMYHRREINICQVCAKEIKDKKAFEKHVRSHFEESGPRLKCPIENCESWLKDEDNLKTHIQRYHLDDKTYKCPDCDKVCPNRRSLSSHKHYFHSKEIFRCEHCDKTFKKALTLKEHMTQHTGETLYNCPFCTRTFNSNANMHSHKKKQHPVEWEELRRKKLGPLSN